MLTLLGARSAAASVACGGHYRFHRPLLAVIALALSGCVPATTSVVTANPADPAAKVARVGYHSTVAPYASLRPSTPAAWRERNDAVTPPPKQDQ